MPVEPRSRWEVDGHRLHVVRQILARSTVIVTKPFIKLWGITGLWVVK